MQLVIPMSGQGRRFQAAGYEVPKPMIPVNGVPIIERLLRRLPERWTPWFVLAENHRDSGLPELLLRLRPNARLRYVAPHSEGPARAVEVVLPELDPAEPLFVSYCDYDHGWDPAAFEDFVRDSAADVVLVTYRGFHAHYTGPQLYAYCRLEGDAVVEVREKGFFTDDREQEHASTGGHYFRTPALLAEGLAAQRELGLVLGGERYLSLTVEALLRTGSPAVRVFEVPVFFQFGLPADLEAYAFWERCLRADLAVRDRGEVGQVLLPMAGHGSRFHEVTPLPKPLIPVRDRPMFVAALDSLPRGEREVLVVRDDASAAVAAARPSATRVTLPATPAGQALSVAAGLSALDPARDVLVSACDHGVGLDRALWRRFRDDPRCDAAIFAVRGYPGADRAPGAHSFVEVDGDGETPRVTRVSVKQPVTPRPSDAWALVGTFWARDPGLLRDAIDQLVAVDRRVNGELYLDSAYELLVEAGVVVRMVPLEGWLCWGDPDSLAEALYWDDALRGRRIVRRPRFPGVPRA